MSKPNPKIGKEFVEEVADLVGQTSRSMSRQLKLPAGRAPDERLVALHEWYVGLGEDDKNRVDEIVERSADLCLFGMLSLLDGRGKVGAQFDDGEVKLVFSQNGESTTISSTTEGSDLSYFFRDR